MWPRAAVLRQGIVDQEIDDCWHVLRAPLCASSCKCPSGPRPSVRRAGQGWPNKVASTRHEEFLRNAGRRLEIEMTHTVMAMPKARAAPISSHLADRKQK